MCNMLEVSMNKTVLVTKVQDKPMKTGGTFHIIYIDGKDYASFDHGWKQGVMYEVEFVTRGDRTNVKMIKELEAPIGAGPTLAADVKKNIYSYEIPKYPAFAMRYATDLTIALINKEIVATKEESMVALDTFFRKIMEKFSIETAEMDADGFLIEEDN